MEKELFRYICGRQWKTPVDFAGQANKISGISRPRSLSIFGPVDAHSECDEYDFSCGDP